MANFFNFGQKMLERQATRSASASNPGLVKALTQIRNTGAPIPSLAQLLGFGMGQGGQRKAGPDKTGAGVAGAARSAALTPKAGLPAGKSYTIADLFGLRPSGQR